jgi:prephenate dehydratase
MTNHQQPVVSIQGEEGSFHHIAAEQLFNPQDLQLLCRATFEEVFQDVDEQKADYGIIACENSIAGSISMNYNRLARYSIPIIAETYLRISHHLMVPPGVEMEDIREIWSHPMAIEQCRNYLNRLDRKIHMVEMEDTAGAVKQIKEQGLTDVAAIASKRASTHYEMNILAPSIETDQENYTRFLILSHHKPDQLKETGHRKTTLHFSVAHKSGSLVAVLQELGKLGVNMTKLESRPQLGTPWEYEFIVDLELNIKTPLGEDVMGVIKERTAFCEVLGCYPTV